MSLQNTKQISNELQAQVIMKYLLIFSFVFIGNTLSNAQNCTKPIAMNINIEANKEKITSKKVVTYKVGRYEEAGDFNIFIPKTFSPNEDGINDIFKIQTKSVINFELMVFDQWGGFVYSDNTINLNWNGKVNDKLVDSGAYVYVIKLTTIDGQAKKYSGCLMIEE